MLDNLTNRFSKVFKNIRGQAKLREDNIKEALKFRPYLVDINSKVEDENGIKSAEKIRKIFSMFLSMKKL